METGFDGGGSHLPPQFSFAAVVASVLLRLAAAGAGAVGVARVGAPGVLSAVVPAGALGHLLGRLADVGLGVVDLALGAAQLVGLLAVEAGEEELAVCGQGCQMAKFDPFLSLGLRQGGGQSKERKGSNFVALRSGAIVPQARRAKHIQS